MPSPAACRGRLHFFTPARTEAKENKYSLGKPVSDGRYSFVGMRSLFGEALCTKLVILQPHRDDRKNVICDLSFRTSRSLLFLQANVPATENFFHRG
jgi:hypothetical protein